jgi:hypothetical protein
VQGVWGRHSVPHRGFSEDGFGGKPPSRVFLINDYFGLKSVTFLLNRMYFTKLRIT